MLKRVASVLKQGDFRHWPLPKLCKVWQLMRLHRSLHLELLLLQPDSATPISPWIHPPCSPPTLPFSLRRLLRSDSHLSYR